MTKEIRLIFDIGEIIGVRYQCLKPTCQGEILYRLDGDRAVNNRCPACRAVWFDTPEITTDMSGKVLSSTPVEPRSYLLQVLRDIARSDRDNSNLSFRARLEMECEETD